MSSPPAIILKPEDIHIWQLMIANDLCKIYTESAILDLLSPLEYLRYQRFRVPGKKNEFLHSRLLLRTLIHYYTPYHPSEIQIIPDELGKPFFYHNSKRIQPNFNLSHTKGMMTCIVGNIKHLGCDIEILSKTHNTDELVRFVLCLEEIDTYQSLPDNQQQPFFLRSWAMKEAYTKALGQGLRIPLDSLRITGILADKGQRIFHTGQLPDSAPSSSSWFFQVFTLTPDYVLAVAVATSSPVFTYLQAELDEIRRNIVFIISF